VDDVGVAVDEDFVADAAGPVDLRVPRSSAGEDPNPGASSARIRNPCSARSGAASLIAMLARALMLTPCQ
jgi:hypothetical protein